MSEFDVIVIGGGPAGCYAGLAAATKGCKVAIFEEHGAIGWPRHDPGWLMRSDFTKSVLSAVEKAVPWTKVDEYRVCRAESGDLVEKSALGGSDPSKTVVENHPGDFLNRARGSHRDRDFVQRGQFVNTSAQSLQITFGNRWHKHIRFLY